MQTEENLSTLFCMSASVLAFRAQSSAKRKSLMVTDRTLVFAWQTSEVKQLSINTIVDVDADIAILEGISQHC